MSWLGRLLKRGPSTKLREAQEFRDSIIAQREEVEEVATSLRKNVRQQNHLAPLIEQVLRSTR